MIENYTGYCLTASQIEEEDEKIILKAKTQAIFHFNNSKTKKMIEINIKDPFLGEYSPVLIDPHV